MTTDLKKPHEWYPLTRIMKRKIIFHGGPTNSGKTYHALQRLKEADVSRGGGLYCGPLRLLALEVYELLNRQGISTSLVTGQEKKEIPGSTHVSSTLEMVSMTREYDVAVIDEIQMIADKDRGYAWTRALLGLRAREVHLCGGLEAEQLVRSLVASSGDEFVLQKYDRLSRLHIEEQSLRGDYTQVQAGDCIVAFSKSDIFSIRRQVGDTYLTWLRLLSDALQTDDLRLPFFSTITYRLRRTHPSSARVSLISTCRNPLSSLIPSFLPFIISLINH
jgi:ATP-dependent RNA helicase SUPV3L1/SUV3